MITTRLIDVVRLCAYHPTCGAELTHAKEDRRGIWRAYCSAHAPQGALRLTRALPNEAHEWTRPGGGR